MIMNNAMSLKIAKYSLNNTWN